jgi:hypothetical protein
MVVLLQEKIELYGADLNQLTELSSLTVIFGKIVTIGFLSWIGYLSSKFENIMTVREFWTAKYFMYSQ